MARDEAPLDTAVGPAGLIVRLIHAMRAMGASDDEIIAAISGSVQNAPPPPSEGDDVTMDEPPRTPGTPIAPTDRKNYPGLTTYPYSKDRPTAMDEASFHARFPGAPAVGIDYKPIRTTHHASPAAAADFHARYPDAARLG